MPSKTEVIRRIELIDQLSTILKDLRRSEMEELEKIEAEESFTVRACNLPSISYTQLSIQFDLGLNITLFSHRRSVPQIPSRHPAVPKR